MRVGIPTPQPGFLIPRTQCVEGWMGLLAGVDGCGKSRLHRDAILGPPSPQRFAIPDHTIYLQQSNALFRSNFRFHVHRM